MKKILVLVAQGSEEIETVILVDVFRRAGWDTTLASIHPGKSITCSRNVRLEADATLETLTDPLEFDALVLPGGGPGSIQFRNSTTVLDLCRAYAAANKWLGAICAAPFVFQDAGLLTHKQATCYPGMRSEFRPGAVGEGAVVVDGRLITSQGPGTTFEFALTFVEHLDSTDRAIQLRKELILP